MNEDDPPSSDQKAAHQLPPPDEEWEAQQLYFRDLLVKWVGIGDEYSRMAVAQLQCSHAHEMARYDNDPDYLPENPAKDLNAFIGAFDDIQLVNAGNIVFCNWLADPSEPIELDPASPEEIDDIDSDTGRSLSGMMMQMAHAIGILGLHPDHPWRQDLADDIAGLDADDLPPTQDPDPASSDTG